jgi:molecular chaperone HscB
MPPPDYFAFFGLEQKLNLDLQDLERRFYALSRKLHPDRWQQATEAERQAALDASAMLNDAYRTLRDPVSRAAYLLKQKGLDAGEARQPPPELLEEIFEYNEALEELRHGEESKRGRVEEARRHFEGLREEADRKLAERFAEYDRAGGEAVLEEVGALLHRRTYLQNLIGTTDAIRTFS